MGEEVGGVCGKGVGGMKEGGARNEGRGRGNGRRGWSTRTVIEGEIEKARTATR